MLHEDIKLAIKESRIVDFDYYSEKKGYSHRTGEPYEIRHTGDSDKLYLWDYSRDQIRAFIIDNISNFKVTNETFVPRKVLRT